MASETEEVLLYLQSNAGRAVKAGWIEKQPVDHRYFYSRWRRKWMELHPHLIVWFNDIGTVPRGYIMLAPTTIVQESPGKGSSIEIVSASGRKLIFRVPDAQEHHRWLSAVSRTLSDRRREMSYVADTVGTPRRTMIEEAEVAASPVPTPPFASPGSYGCGSVAEELAESVWSEWDTQCVAPGAARSASSARAAAGVSHRPPPSRGVGHHRPPPLPDSDDDDDDDEAGGGGGGVGLQRLQPQRAIDGGVGANREAHGSSRRSEKSSGRSSENSIPDDRTSQRLERLSLFRMRSLEEVGNFRRNSAGGEDSDADDAVQMWAARQKQRRASSIGGAAASPSLSTIASLSTVASSSDMRSTPAASFATTVAAASDSDASEGSQREEDDERHAMEQLLQQQQRQRERQREQERQEQQRRRLSEQRQREQRQRVPPGAPDGIDEAGDFDADESEDESAEHSDHDGAAAPLAALRPPRAEVSGSSDEESAAPDEEAVSAWAAQQAKKRLGAGTATTAAAGGTASKPRQGLMEKRVSWNPGLATTSPHAGGSSPRGGRCSPRGHPETSSAAGWTQPAHLDATGPCTGHSAASALTPPPVRPSEGPLKPARHLQPPADALPPTRMRRASSGDWETAFVI